MTWVRLDDGFFSNVKVVSVSKDARLLHLAALCYAGGQQTDGRIPRRAVRLLGAQAEVEDVESCAAELVEQRLWEVDGDDYQVHDFLKYNPAKADLERMRDARSSAGRKGALAKQVLQQEPEQMPQQKLEPEPGQMVSTLTDVDVDVDENEDDNGRTDERTNVEPSRKRGRRASDETMESVLADEAFLAEQRGRWLHSEDLWQQMIADWTGYREKNPPAMNFWHQCFRAEVSRKNEYYSRLATSPRIGTKNNGRGAPNVSNNGAWSAALGRQIGHGTGRLVEAADG